MMKNYDKDDTFLGRWIAGELSEEELIDFKKTETYKQFKLINKESQLLSGPDIDIEAALRNVKQKLKPAASKPKTIQLWQTISIAVMVIISIGIYINSSKTFKNGIGETQNIVLEDDSNIYLNANSSISLKRFFWSSDKTVTLKGEAYFTINKGDDFKVETPKGTVKVLGTEFNIKDRILFELKCYEGKVSFTQKNEDSLIILTKGMQINIEEDRLKNITFKDDIPSWRKGISKFDKKPMYLVLEELTQYFEITFDSKNINVNRLFSGSFDHKDIDIALRATLVPMGIKYKLEQNVYTLSE